MDSGCFLRIIVILLVFILGTKGVSSANFYSRTSGNWNNASTWSNTACGGTAATAIPGAGDNVTICAGHTVTMNGNPGNCLSLYIAGTANWTQNLTTNVGSGGLTMAGGTISGSATGSLNVSGNFIMSGTNSIGRCNITISGTTTISSTLILNNTAGTKTFTDFIITSAGTFNNTVSEDITVNGNFQNDGTFIINSGRVTFGGASSNTVTGTSTTNFNTVTLNKGTSVSNILDIQSPITMSAGGLTLLNGTFKISSASNITPFTTALANIIPTNAGFWHNGTGTVNMPISVQYSGTLRISSGTLNIGDAADERIIAINGTTVLTVEGGTLNIAGRISRGVATDYITFTMSGGTVTVPTIASTSNTFAPIMMDQTGSTFTMTGGTLIIQREGGTGAADLGMVANAGTVGISGGVIQFGDASTPPGQTMNMDCIFNIANLTVNSPNATCRLADNLSVLQAVTINSGTLNANNFNLSVGGLWTNNGTFIPGTGTVTFNGTGTQTITKTGGETFYNLTVNKSSGSVSLASDVTVSNTLTMTQGNIMVNSNTLTLGTGIAAPGMLSYTAGTIVGCFRRWCSATATPYLFPVGTSSFYRPVQVTFNSLTGGTLASCFVSSDPGTNGLPLIESTRTITATYTEGYWDLTAANGLSSTNYNIACTGNGFTSYPIGSATRLLYRTSSASPWTLNGTHVNASGNTANRNAVSGATAQLCFGKPVCSSYAATSISGDSTVCASDAGITYSVNASNPANTYVWTITGGTIASGQGTPTVTVNWGGTPMPNANMQMVEQNDCAENNTAINKNVWINPIATSTISGPTTVAQNETGVQYSVTGTPEYTYTWSLPSGGGTIVGGQGTATVTINWGATAGTYIVQVTATRLCGAPDVQTLAVQVRAPIRSAASGNWTNTATWIGGVVPTANDYVEIQSGHTVTMNGNPGVCRKLTINGIVSWTQARTTNVGTGGIIINSTGNITGTAAGVLTSTGGLTGTGNGNISSTTVTIRLQTNPQNITSAGALNILDVTTTVTNTGTVTIGTSGTLSGSGTFMQGNNSVLNMNGNTFSVTGFNASATGNTVSYGAGSAQTIRAGTYHHLSTSGNGTKTMAGAITVNGNVNIGTNTTLDVSASNYALTVKGNWNNSGDFNERFGTVTFNGSTAQTITNAAGETFNNLVMSGSGAKNMSNAITINFDFSLSTTLNTNNNNISIRGNFDNSGTYNGGTNNVTFTHNTSLLGSSPTTFNNVIINANATLTGHPSNFNVTGNWTNNGGFNHNNGTVTFSGNTTIGGSSTNSFGGVIISGTLTAPTGNMNVARNFTNNGTFHHNNGTITFNGTSAQIIGGTTVTDFYNITQNNSSGVNLARDANLINALTISSGTFTTTGYNFTLRSTASNTARIAAIPAGANIAGNIIMERYSGTGPTDWRFLCSSVSGNTLQDWDNEIITAGFPGSDYPTFNWPSIYWYDETKPDHRDTGFVVPTNITNSIVAGKGYWVYLGPNPVTFNSIGHPYKFSQSPSVTYTNSGSTDDDGWNLIANPYPSAIDWDSPDWTKVNLDNAIYSYNSNTGSYASYVGGIGTNGGSRYIASQQAFWVKANAASPSLSAVENVKATSNPSHLKMKITPNTSLYPMAFHDFPIPQNTNNHPNSILLTLSGNGQEDETFVQFIPAATYNFDNTLDAWKLFGMLNLSSVQSDSLDYSINCLPVLTSDVSIKLRVKVPSSGMYFIRRDSMLMLPMSSCIFLQDLVTGTLTDLRQNVSYSFFASDTASAPRFLLHVYAPITKKSFPVSCFGSNTGMAVAKGTGNGPWNYTWKDINGNVLQSKNNVSTADTLFNLQAGVYSVEVSGSACGTVTDTITIISPQQLNVNAVFADVSCNGLSDGTAFVTASGGVPPYTYLWNNGFTSSVLSGLAEGTYSLTVTDANGCTGVISAHVSAPVTADFIVNKDTLYLSQNDTALFINKSEGALFYQWNFGDSSPIDSSLHPSHYYAAPGNYTVTLISSDSTCYDTVSYVVVVLDSLLTHIPSSESGNNFSAIYSHGDIILSFNLSDKENVAVSVYNMLGERIYSNYFVSVQKNIFYISADELSAGIYLITAETTHALISRKLCLFRR